MCSTAVAAQCAFSRAPRIALSTRHARLTCLAVVLGVGHHSRAAGHPIGHVKESGNTGDVPDISIREALVS